MRLRRKLFVKAPLLIAIVALLGWIVMRLWNWIVPELITGAHAIDYPHAIGLLVLSRILFGGFRGHGGCRERAHWHRWQRMTPEERNQLRGATTPSSRQNGETNA